MPVPVFRFEHVWNNRTGFTKAHLPLSVFNNLFVVNYGKLVIPVKLGVVEGSRENANVFAVTEIQL